MFKRVEHVEIVSSDMKRTLNFYTEILGFDVQTRRTINAPPTEEIAFIELGGTLVEVFAIKEPAAVSNETWQVGCRRIALEVDDMDAAIAYLTDKGVQPSMATVNTETSAMSEIKDPDGIPIQLIQRK
ncbi:MAG: VOC family protein [Dehalococcoidales bacterium]|jgi:glyoxylase I family protein|nr:VOC family protein [Dehalococcoidales bacterium]MDP7525528.1 VOC family protein [Dehalococcoidales bacterium]